jgi:DNA-binding NarL/FixJ family response regulator
MRVILADDQPDVRSAMRLLFEERPGISIIGEASSMPELVRQVKVGSPDLVLLDWELPGNQAQDLMTLLGSQCPRLAVIALSSSPQVKQAALKAGVLAFVCKSDPPELLINAVDKYLRERSCWRRLASCPPPGDKASGEEF